MWSLLSPPIAEEGRKAVKLGSFRLVAVMALAFAAAPAVAMPFMITGVDHPAVEPAQFNPARVRPQMPTGGGGGGGRFPGGGGIFIDPGVLIGPLVAPPRGPRVIIEEYDDDEEPVRPRPRAKRQPDQRAAPPRQPPRQQQARPATPRLPPVSVPRANERRYVARRGAARIARRRGQCCRDAPAQAHAPFEHALRAGQCNDHSRAGGSWAHGTAGFAGNGRGCAHRQRPAELPLCPAGGTGEA